jgi:hypothetical protein
MYCKKGADRFPRVYGAGLVKDKLERELCKLMNLKEGFSISRLIVMYIQTHYLRFHE